MGANSPSVEREPSRERDATDARAGSAGLDLGGILVITGIVIAMVWSVWVRIIIALAGLVAFAKGKWQ